MKQLLLDIQPAPPQTLDNFIVGHNAEAVANIYYLLEDAAESSFIYFWGEAGSGKSHLLNAASNLGIDIADDVHLLDNDAQIDLFNRYNQLKADDSKLIAAGLHAPSQMHLRDDLATRLAWGLVYQLQPLTDAEKAEALKNHAKERGMRLPDEVIAYCLRYLRRDLPTLMSILNALDEWSLTEKKPITVPMLKRLLQLDLDI
ncbi:MAG: DnaA/Hda family protein [Methylophilaceae bacterium]|jgi:DnaA-homolog protein|nr:DnaA/Hda family protein [Methylophilaceae bacterium]MDG1454404.1 DnaA/Hda family protein [Methylophilaceae bacterium]